MDQQGRLIVNAAYDALNAKVDDEEALVPLALVEKCLRAWDDPVVTGNLPWVGVCSTFAKHQPEPFEHEYSIMRLDIWAHAAVPAPVTIDAKLVLCANLAEMIKGVISPNVGGTAISATRIDSYNDAQHPDFSGPDGGVFTLTQEWEVRYAQRTSEVEA